MKNRNSVFSLVAVLTLMGTVAYGAKKNESSHQFGPTGFHGTVKKTTITVTKIDKGSPADGKISPKAVVIGVGGNKFKKDVRKEMAAAINVAETEAAGGTLTLMLKGGKSVDLTLKVLGSYSATAPYDCPKTKAIIDRAAEALLKKGMGSRGQTEALALMATGEQKYLDAVKKYVHSPDSNKSKKQFIPPPDQKFMDDLLNGDTDAGYVTWSWGYRLIFLSEYYLMTKDESVLPAIKIYAVTLARGQDAGGMFGHRLVTVKRNGRLPGYAQMNQPSLICFMGMLLAEKCGVKDPRLTKGIETSYRYFASHIDKGAFPYGVHGPKSAFYNNNGTSGSAAVCMAIKGNKHGAEFFAKLSSTSYDTIETGHTGHFFNVMWTPLGANVGGPELTKRFFRKTRWLHTLYRTWDGRFTFDGGNFKGGDSTGSHLLAYCVPRRKLCITGKTVEKSDWLTAEEAEAAVNYSKLDYGKMSTEELETLVMKPPLPQVRRGAIAELTRRLDKLDPMFGQYLKSGTDPQKALAANAYPWWIPVEKRLPRLDDIGAVLRDPKASMRTRVAAAGSIAFMGEPAKNYFMDIITLLAMDRPDDPFGLVDSGLGSNAVRISTQPFTDGLVTDKELFYKAAIKLIDNKRQGARGTGLKLLADMPLEDFHIVADKVVHVLEDKDSTYHSYHNPGTALVPAVAIMAHLNIKEGLDYTQGILKLKSGKGSFKIRGYLACLGAYGAHAKPILEANDNHKEWSKNKKLSRSWRSMMKAVEADKTPKKLISLKDAIRAGRDQ